MASKTLDEHRRKRQEKADDMDPSILKMATTPSVCKKTLELPSNHEGNEIDNLKSSQTEIFESIWLLRPSLPCV